MWFSVRYEALDMVLLSTRKGQNKVSFVTRWSCSGRRAVIQVEQENSKLCIYLLPHAARARARLICVNGCVLRPSLEGIKDIFINFLYI